MPPSISDALFKDRASLAELLPTSLTPAQIASAHSYLTRATPNRLFNNFKLSQLLDPAIAEALTQKMAEIYNNIASVTIEESNEQLVKGQVSGRGKVVVSPSSIRENLADIYHIIAEIGLKDLVKEGALDPTIITILELQKFSDASTTNIKDPQAIADILSSFLEATSREIRQNTMLFLSNQRRVDIDKLPGFLALNGEIVREEFGKGAEHYLKNIKPLHPVAAEVKPKFAPKPPSSPPPSPTSSSTPSSPSSLANNSPKRLFSPRPPSFPPPPLDEIPKTPKGRK